MIKIKKIFSILLCLICLTGCLTEIPNVLPDDYDKVNNNEEIIVRDQYLEINGESIPKWNGLSPYVEVNDNKPFILDKDTIQDIKNIDDYEVYSELDALERCGSATAMISIDTMPTEKRESIGMIKPSGWNQKRYDDLIKDKYLYNRCHLIGFQLAGENANKLNLITGTRYLNVEGMLPFENRIAEYVKDTQDKVYYKVTPIFVNQELVARGVLMEAQSVNSNDVVFNIFCYNVQPGISINYQDGSSYRE